MIMHKRPVFLALLLLSGATAVVSARPIDGEGRDHRSGAGPLTHQPAHLSADVRAELPPVPRAALDRARSAQRPALRASQTTHGPAARYTTMIDDFEGVVLDPSLWPFVGDLDADPPTNGEYFWGLSGNRAATGKQSLWAIGAGADGSKLKAGDNYACGVRSAAWVQLDLTKWASPKQLDFVVDFWLNTRTYDEGGVVPDGIFISTFLLNENDEKVRVVLKALTAEFPKRFWEEPITIDLLAAKEIYPPNRELDLSGKQVLMEFLFKTKDPDCTTLPEGLYIDNLRIVSDVEPQSGAPTETPAPTAIPSVTEVAPTVTPGPTDVGPTPSPFPSETPIGADTPTPTVAGPVSTPTPVVPTSTPDTQVTPVPPGRLFVPYVSKP